MQTSVKSQEARGTCSIFSAVAMLESLLLITKDAPRPLDYSEEYLQLLISPGKKSSGSSSYSNIPAMGRNGLPKESEFPYVGEEWKSADQTRLSKIRCGKVPSGYQPSCLVGHRDTRLLTQSDATLDDPKSPFYDQEFLKARTSSKSMQNKYLYNVSSYITMSGASQVYQRLNEGLPVLFDVDFYYGAWNHRKAEDSGIKRNMTQWYNGIVTYPEPGSLDIEAYNNDPAGHSVLIIGYDNNAVVTNTVQMQDGTTKEFTYTGIFFFKNSWGTTSFGNTFSFDGKKYPGYGIITQKYALEKGQFFKMDI